MNKCFEKIYLIVSPIYILQSNSVQQNIADIIAKEKSSIGLEYFWASLLLICEKLGKIEVHKKR